MPLVLLEARNATRPRWAASARKEYNPAQFGGANRQTMTAAWSVFVRAPRAPVMSVDILPDSRACSPAAAKWFEAVIAATDSNNPLFRKASGRKSWLDKAKRRLIGNHGESAVVLGDRARETGKWELAVRYYRDAPSLEPDEPRVWTKLGHSLREAGKIVEAEIAYRKALELDVDDPDTRAALAGTLAMQGKSIEPYRLASIKS